jgi:hypothetical protein
MRGAYLHTFILSCRHNAVIHIYRSDADLQAVKRAPQNLFSFGNHRTTSKVLERVAIKACIKA